jgi:hypothetical protein
VEGFLLCLRRDGFIFLSPDKTARRTIPLRSIMAKSKRSHDDRARATTKEKSGGGTAPRANRRSRNDDHDAATEAVVAASAAESNSIKKRKASNENDGGGSNGTDAAADGAGKEGDLRAPHQPSRDEEDNNNEPCRSLKIQKRPEIFPVPDTWWMVDVHARPVPKQGATPLVLRCMRAMEWKEPKARGVLRAYRQFLSVKVATKDWDAQRLSPSLAVDRMWRQRVLDNLNYAHDCRLVCGGHFVRHDPDGGEDIEAQTYRLAATRQALLECYGGEEEEGGGGCEVDRSSTGP